MDEDLLAKIDADPDAQREGRSAFIRTAVSSYLQAKRRRQIDAAIQTAYEGQADAMLKEIADLMAGQEWPDE